MWSKIRFLFLLIIDAVLVTFGLLIAFYLRFMGEEGLFNYYLNESIEIFFLAIVIYLTSFIKFRIYNRFWTYASTGELLAVINSVSIGALGTIAASSLLRMTLPRSIIILSWAFTILLIGGSRFAWRLYVENKKSNGISYGRKALIVGAGDAGAMVARELSNNKHIDLKPVGYVDDDPSKRNMSLLGIPVLGNREEIPDIINRHKIDEIIIAMPSVDGQSIREIVQISQSTQCSIKILPGVYEIIDGRVSIDRLRPLQLEDLLHREPVNVSLEGIAGYLKGKVVIVTGAGGSIGSELCRQIAVFEPSLLIVLGHGENSIHKIWHELGRNFPELNLVIEIADVRDSERIEHIFNRYQPQVVFHAAAHKHVPLMEMHPVESVKTNVFGTRNVANAALMVNAEVFIMISTDKAVNPSSVMGATKRLAELMVNKLINQKRTIFASVRFGNVLGSNGSVVQVFRDQIRRGGPITVTHPDMTRFFMTIPEAVSLVIQAGTMARGGEIFVLDMGEPVKILDLAYDMIRLSGYEPERDIDIVFTGIRPGEKLFEELMTLEEGTSSTCHSKIFVARSCLVDNTRLQKEIEYLEMQTADIDGERIFEVLKKVIPGFINYRNKSVESCFKAVTDSPKALLNKMGHQ
ncbi:MAG: polysaccharide biosynthesis protein [Peptococcaceae bacterium BICA1-7]|nr:MAG: polysaccharide biosynthesis protein [Peptococcaceae bacterium BICA1-7]